MLEKQLQELGLADKEAKVYLAALELGSSTVQQISRKCGVNRPTTYVQIEFLKKKGLMSTVVKGKKRYFNAESPEQLVRILDKRKQVIEAQKNEFEKYLPELKALYNLSDEKPSVKFYEGEAGIISMQKDILNTETDELREVADIDNIFKNYSSGSDNYLDQIKNKLENISTYVIYTSKNGPTLSEKEGKYQRLFVPSDKFKFSSEIIIYGKDKVSFINPVKVNGVIVENKEIHDTIKSLFDLIWNK